MGMRQALCSQGQASHAECEGEKFSWEWGENPMSKHTYKFT